MTFSIRVEELISVYFHKVVCYNGSRMGDSEERSFIHVEVL